MYPYEIPETMARCIGIANCGEPGDTEAARAWLAWFNAAPRPHDPRALTQELRDRQERSYEYVLAIRRPNGQHAAMEQARALRADVDAGEIRVDWDEEDGYGGYFFTRTNDPARLYHTYEGDVLMFTDDHLDTMPEPPAEPEPDQDDEDW